MFLDDIKFIQITPEAFAQAPQLIELFGETAYDNEESFKTILCGWDDSEHTRKRGMKLGETAMPTILTNGNLGFVGLPSEAAFNAWTNGEIEGVTELTEAEFQSLIPKSEL